VPIHGHRINLLDADEAVSINSYVITASFSKAFVIVLKKLT